MSVSFEFFYAESEHKMLVFYQAALAVCAVFLVSIGAALASAYRLGNKRQIDTLRLLWLGLILSACSYLLGIFDSPRPGHVSLLSFFFCLSGTALIWRGFRENGKMQQERRNMPRANGQEAEPAATTLAGLPSDLPLLTLSTQQALLYAQQEACRCRQSCVDTEHLLLGLLRTPQSAGVCILDCLGIGLEKLHLDLIVCAAGVHGDLDSPSALAWASPGLTKRASQVMSLADQEAHRFEKTAVGTEHLLLGLVLIGKGKAASVLFAEGVTGDRIRNEILKRKQNRES